MALFTGFGNFVNRMRGQRHGRRPTPPFPHIPNSQYANTPISH